VLVSDASITVTSAFCLLSRNESTSSRTSESHYSTQDRVWLDEWIRLAIVHFARDVRVGVRVPVTVDTVRSFAEEHLPLILPQRFEGRFFLAGGCFKSLIHGHPARDLDFWPASEHDRKNLLQALQDQGCTLVQHGQ